MNSIIIKNIGQLVTMKGEKSPRKGSSMKDVEILEDAYVYIVDDMITEVGVGKPPYANLGLDAKIIDAKGLTITPGLIDPHTHLVHGGSREHELSKKLDGVPYMDILKAGGGILSTVRSTKVATKEELYKRGRRSLDTMLSYGVTSIEAKSGYGLDIKTEIKQMEVAKELDDTHPIDIVSTFLGAHAVPTGCENSDLFVEDIINMLPIVKDKELAEYCDVFCEEGVFSVEQTRRILLAAKELGYGVKLHADEIVSLGGAELSAELGAISADHLMAASENGMEKMAEAGVIANILPGTSFNLGKDYAPVRKMIEKGLAVALSTDYNPGSCPTENLQFIMQLGSLKLRMTPKEVLTAVTINAAYSIGRGDEIGSIEVGKKADLAVFDVPNIDYLIYHYGINHTKAVYKSGKLVYQR